MYGMREKRDALEDSDQWLNWLLSAEMAVCDHLEMVDESSIGPDSGSEEFYCPRCGWSFSHTYY